MTHISNPKHTPPVKSPREYEARIAELEARLAPYENVEPWYTEPKPDDPATTCNGTGQVPHPYGQRHCKGCANCGGAA